MNKVYKALEKTASVLFYGQKAVLLVLAVGSVAITITDVLLRFTIKSGLAWAQEACIAIFMTLIFLGANIAMKTGSEIKIDLLHFKNESAQRALLTVIDLVSLCAIVYLFCSSVASVRNASARPQLLATIPFSYATLYLVMPIGFALMFLDKLVAMLRRFFDRDLEKRMKETAEEMENSDK